MKTKFNPENKAVLTFGECLDPAMSITEEADAQQYLAAYAAYIQQALDKEPRNDEKTAAQIAASNLAYYAGYCNDTTRERVERLFKCEHPIFGSIAKKGPPTAKEAFEAGKRLAKPKKSKAFEP